MNGILATFLDYKTIGLENTLPWKDNDELYELARLDMSYFAGKTRGKKLVMGWNTWVSFGEKPLPKRDSFIVITSKKTGCEIFNDVKNINNKPTTVEFMPYDEFLRRVDINDDNLWLIGGAHLYDTLLLYCLKIYLNVFCLSGKGEERYTTHPKAVQLKDSVLNILAENKNNTYEMSLVDKFNSLWNTLKMYLIEKLK